MKTKLLKNLMMLVVFFTTITMSAQLYNFSDGDQGWVKGYGAGTVAHDPTGGVSGDGALTINRAGNNNANIRRGQGGDDTFIVLNRATIKFIKIRYKNETKGSTFRIQGNSRAPGATGLGDSFSNIVVGGIAVESSEFKTVYVDVTTIPAGHEVTRLDILIRGNNPDADGALCIYDEIEFLEDIPVEYSEFIKNPSFDGPTGLTHLTGASPGASREITTAEFHDGAQSLAYTYTADATNNFWAFTNYEKVYPSVYTAGSEVQIKMWVKTNRSTPITIQTRLKLTNGGVVNDIKPIASVTTTNTAMEWEELTFNMEIPFDFDGVTYWFNIAYEDETAGAVDENLNAGDMVFIDQMTATLTLDNVLKIDDNVLEGVHVFVNQGSESLNIASPINSSLNLYNILGRKVKSIEKLSKNNSISVSDLSSGIYIVRINSEGKSYSKKIILK